MKIVTGVVLLLTMCFPLVADTLLLKNGDELNGTVTLGADGKLTLTHDVLGTVELNSNAVSGGSVSVKLSDGDKVSGMLIGYKDGMWLIKPPEEETVELTVEASGSLKRVPEPAESASSEPPVRHEEHATEVTKEMKAAAEERIAAAKKVIADAEKVLKNEWSGTISLGGSVSRGTADASNVLLNIGITREVPDSKTEIDAFYILNTSNEETTQNWFQASLDHSWDIPGTDGDWGLFGLAVFDWQETVSWEQRVNGNIGVQYLLVNATRDPGTDWFEKMKIRGRVGPGFRKEFAGDFTDWTFEVLLGGTWEITFLKGVTLRGNAQAYPDLSNIGQVRVTANTNFMVALESLKGVSVGLGLRFQYQSQVTPGDEDYLLVVSGQVAYDF